MLNEIRILKFSSIYSGLISKISREITSEMDSSEAMSHVFSKRFGLSNFYEEELLKLKVEAKDFLLGVDLIDKLLRNELQLKEKDNLVIELIKKHKPSVVFIQDFSLVNEQVAIFLKENRSRFISLGYLCSPVGEKQERFLDCFDALLTCTPGFMNFFKFKGLKSFRLNHAFSNSLFEGFVEPSSFLNRKNSMLFSGSIFPGGQYHNKRIRGIYDFKHEMKDGLDLYLGHKNLNIFWKSIFSLLCWVDYTSIRKLGTLEAKMMRDVLQSESSDLIFGLKMYEKFRDYRFVFNQHINAAGDFAGNVRLFEATGVGACLITDNKSNMKEYFEQDEVVTYDSIQDAIRKLHWLIENPQKAYEIALAGQKRTLRCHTYKNRAEELLGIISEIKR